MIRECNASDLETLEAYLKEEVYGKVILSLIEKNGFEQAAQSVYGDFEEGVCKGVYLCIYKNLLLYRQEKAAAMPELLDQEGQPLESDEECSGAVEKGWGILLK